MSFVKVQGVVISARNINDSDKIITLLSDKLGKIDIVANGCRKPKSRFMASVQMFCYGEYVLTTGKNLHTLKESNILESFQGIILNLDKVAYGSYFLELIDNLIEKDMKNVHLLALTLKTLYILLHGDISLLPLLRVTFDFKAISLAGYMPQVFRCVNCGDSNGPYVFSAASGGILCKKCVDTKELTLTAQELNLLQTLKNIKLEDLHNLNVSSVLVMNIQNMISFYIRNYIEREFKSLQLLKVLS
ncbi:DNA repair protein RecO [Clostridium cylindrosporum]|uniref:DNA repair protein RecO n=1 Tax=Clostridium cylindrosporum DSM 605 TaxID=1121307 RepID=A0A0J8DBI6_CLOCY|nr:DNA repair protein RecO [Clostridium cylindrosporum]KMT21658.1 DNA repair protein RecO [Clostridium cylindrosporum DSM 605]